MTTCATHLSLTPAQPGIPLPTSQVRGCGRNCVGIQGPCLFLFRSWGAAWAKPAKEGGGGGEKREAEGARHSAQGSPAPTTAPTHHFPARLGGQPHAGKWNHSMEHWKRKTVEEQRAGGRLGPSREPPPPPGVLRSIPLLHPAGGFEGSKANHLQLPSSCPEVPLFSPYPSSGTQLPSCPPEPRS